MTDGKKIRIGLFAGTTEGRILAERIAGMALDAVSLDIFVATEYGKNGLPEAENIRTFCGRMDEKEIFERFENRHYDLVIDATHPYARLVSENVKEACRKAGIRRMRVLREPGKMVWESGRSGENERSGECEIAGARIIPVDSIEEAVAFLKETKGPVLVTTGSKELYKYKELPDWENRIFARVLSLPQVVSDCAALGFYGSHLIAMQGPFSTEMNLALLDSTKARWMVTKESGKAGGFEEKEEAAFRAGAGLIVIGRPEEDGISLKEAVECLEAEFRKGKTKVSLIGAGPGSTELLTGEAKRALESCQVILGARRIVQGLSKFGKPVIEEYEPEKILAFLKSCPEYKNVCVALSGDTGFYSGAKKLKEALEGEHGIELSILPGISSVNYFFAKLGETWEDAGLLSLHGREADLIGEVMRRKKVFVLAGGTNTLKDICSRLIAAGLSDVTLTVGENLSLPEERIFEGTPETLRDRETKSLAVVLVRNPNPAPKEVRGLPEGRPESEACKTAGKAAGKAACEIAYGSEMITHGLKDEAFLRGQVPMTKMEVRTVSISKLCLTKDAVIYDVGAGTGSVSVECARLSEGIKVYAIERKEEAVSLLRENREKFRLSNMEIVEGEAPEAMEKLPAPTHVFIGGSGGKMRQVVENVLLKNPEARFVINLITLESVAAATEILRQEPVADVEIVQLTAARAKKAGKSHLMMGQNPVWIVSFQGEPASDGAGKE